MKKSARSLLLSLPALAIVAQAQAAEWSPGYLWAQQALDVRCSKDYLAPAEAKGRVNWSLTHHAQETAEYWSYIAIGDVNFVGQGFTLPDIVDMVRKEWLQMPNGSERPRPLYPLWGVEGDTTTPAELPMSWRAPTDPAAAPKDRADAHIRAKCTSSCYKPEVRVFFPGGYRPIAEAVAQRFPKVIALSDASTFDNLQFKVSNVAAYTQEVQEAKHVIASIRTAGGGHLEVTLNHPLVDGTGVMREAQTFKVGDALVRTDGTRDTIVNIRREDHVGQVYNLRPTDETLLSQVVVAEGFLSGSAWYQNDGANNLNRDIFRLNLPDTLVE